MVIHIPDFLLNVLLVMTHEKLHIRAVMIRYMSANAQFVRVQHIVATEILLTFIIGM